MLLRLSKNAFVRQYGPYTYILHRISNYDQMFVNAEAFMQWITRTPAVMQDVVGSICKTFPGVDQRMIINDFDDFIAPLISEKVIVAGETVSDLDNQDESFSYDVDNPKTMDTNIINPRDKSSEIIPQDVLDRHFEEHPTIFDLQIDVTQACTERCAHCYIPEYNPIFLPIERIEKVIDEFRAQGGIGLSLSGGECMLHPDFERIVRYAREKDLIVCVLSNLTLCNQGIVDLLREVDATVQVSLYSMDARIHDAITKVAGSFAKTKAAIELLRQANVPCRISCPTMKQNYKGYLEVLKYARSLRMDAQTDFIIMGKMNCDTSNLSCRLDLDETRQILEDIVCRAVPVNSEYFNPGKKILMDSDETFVARKVCGACVSSVCLDATGYYYPCPAFSGVNLGSCYEHNLNWIWTKSPETVRIRSVRGRDFRKCVHCENRNYCSVCMCRNYNETGDIFSPAEHFCKVAALNRKVVEERESFLLSSEKGGEQTH